MSYQILIDPLARIDMDKSIAWYNEQQPKLGKQFYRKVQSAVDLIKKSPYSFAIRYQDTRMAPVEKFPFRIHYTIDEEKRVIPILAVLHTSRHPNVGQAR